MSDKKIKAVLFDLGETLLNFGRFDQAQLFRQGARASYEYLMGIGQPVGNFTYYYWRNLIALRIRHLFSNILRRDFDALALLKKAGTRQGLHLAPEQWRHLAWLWYEPLSRISRAEPKIKQTLTALKNAGLKLGIVSNTFVSGESLDRHLKQVGILELFPVRVYSYEFNFRKPNTAIFKIAADRIGELAENILFVGDRIDTDIKPAMKTGMKAVLKAAYTNTGKKPPQGTWKIDQLSELLPLIVKINAEAGNDCHKSG